MQSSQHHLFNSGPPSDWAAWSNQIQHTLAGVRQDAAQEPADPNDLHGITLVEQALVAGLSVLRALEPAAFERRGR
jgi:hypothetical protein